MRFSIVIKEVDKLKLLKDKIINIFINTGYGFIYDEINPNLVICLGGDGTFLKGVHKYIDLNPLFVGINEGNLGFLCEWTRDEIEDILDLLNSINPKFFYYRLLSLEINKEIYYALNEIRVESSLGKSLSFDVLIDDDYLEKFNGDGMCFSTSIGSSAFSRGLNGSLIDHRLEVIEISEKTPINNRKYSTLRNSLIVPDKSNISLVSFSQNEFNIFYDNLNLKVNNIDQIDIKLSNKTIKILKKPDISFINKINDSFIK